MSDAQWGKPMEEKVNAIDGRVGKLETWRGEKVDPWLKESDVHHRTVEKFLATYDAEQKLLKEAQEQRHRENQDKLNSINTQNSHLNLIGTVALILIGVFGLVVSIAALAIAFTTMKHQGYLENFHSDIPATIAMHGGYQ